MLLALERGLGAALDAGVLVAGVDPRPPRAPRLRLVRQNDGGRLLALLAPLRLLTERGECRRRQGQVFCLRRQRQRGPG